ncbi:MAG TPA: AraC family transcriptional regulator [Cyclobacteriaceae bacterium]|nr:AraC family transcriptional regulator [Cyclobacteriaceae bacterium]
MSASLSAHPKIYLYKRIVQAKLFMDSNFRENIDLDNISGEASFSKFHFIRLFKKIYGKTPHQYLIALRIEKATEKLKEGLNVTDACCEVGFDSLTSFSGLFKRKTGLAPYEYARQQAMTRERINASPLNYVPGCFAEKKGWRKKSNFEEAG